ncbi:glycoside hydrolase [Lentinus brumalis]|uniref:Glycoside hydrolase n=1 Tax=Lentinus brumalis TaxID=2498619 RepID=A0A371CZQ3_9APHY|nr:glycoside hydrolase [Polyporus brumalis]
MLPTSSQLEQLRRAEEVVCRADWQQILSHYCEDDSIDAIPLPFVNVFFGAGGVPSLDFANICNAVDDAVFPGTALADCSFLAADIQTCQCKGKIIHSVARGLDRRRKFLRHASVWCGVLDGIDLDIEGGGTTYFASGAPQCQFPDAYMSTVLNAVDFDAVYVQFYNNFCGVISYSKPNAWNFDQWDNWAKTTSTNPDVKIYIGAPPSSTAAGGYTRSKYSSFGGIMLWDASQAYANGRFDQGIKNAIRQNGNGGTTSAPVTVSTPSASTTTLSVSTPSTVTTTTTSSSAAAAATAVAGSCASVSSWVANVAYNGGEQVIYNWTANWWTFGSTPGGSVEDWKDDGACSSSRWAIYTNPDGDDLLE